MKLLTAVTSKEQTTCNSFKHNHDPKAKHTHNYPTHHHHIVLVLLLIFVSIQEIIPCAHAHAHAHAYRELVSLLVQYCHIKWIDENVGLNCLQLGWEYVEIN